MIDYKLKSFVLDSGLCEFERDLSKRIHFCYGELNSLQKQYSSSTPLEQSFILEKILILKDKLNSLNNEYVFWCANESLWGEAQKINRAKYARVIRLKRRIKSMLERGVCFFLTLTFTDSYLNSTSPQTRRRYVTQYFRDISASDAVANIDFGKINGREHYHAVVLVDNIDFHFWKYGNLDFRICKYNDSDSERLSKYVAKLTNHAIKVTTKRNNIIYLRK